MSVTELSLVYMPELRAFCLSLLAYFGGLIWRTRDVSFSFPLSIFRRSPVCGPPVSLLVSRRAYYSPQGELDNVGADEQRAG